MYFYTYYTCLLLFMELDYIKALLTDLNDISYYETIELIHKDLQGTFRRDLSTFSPDRITHFQDSNFYFSGHGRQFDLMISKSEYFLPDTYRRIHQNEDGKYSYSSQVEHCFYHGYLVNKTKSSASISTCFGLKGVITDEDGEEFHIEPHPSDVQLNLNVHHNKSRYILYKTKDIINIENDVASWCGVNDSHIFNREGADFMKYQAHSKYSIEGKNNYNGKQEKYRRSTTNTNLKYIEVIVVIDCSKFIDLGANLTVAEHRALEVLNMVDQVYKTMDTRVAVINVVIWNLYDMANVTTNIHETLRSFEKYTHHVLSEKLKLPFDNVQLLTNQSWGRANGLALIDVMCTPVSAAINNDFHSNAAITANIVAHEMGHNLGLYHYNSRKCTCAKEPCVMTDVTPRSPSQSFTDCSARDYVENIAKGRLSCLLDYPGRFFGAPKCGNGFLEKGEECDCGSEEECRKSNLDQCCNFATCKLRTNAQCATGTCCENCKFKQRGTLCRSKSNSDCDLEEFCTGNSSYCPQNYYIQDGSSCNNDTAYCYQGTCRTHDVQCEELWGPNAMTALDTCYEMNYEGPPSVWRNCGKNDRGNYIKCPKQDILCGKLHCLPKPNSQLPRFPIIGTNRARQTVRRSDGLLCYLGKTLMPHSQDPTIVKDGVKCANDSICIENKCRKVSTLTYIKNCSETCLQNGGVCNNNGNCHCPKGKACPNCEVEGPGGSLDSGQGCIFKDGTSCKDCYYLFFLLVPAIGSFFLVFCCCRNKRCLSSMRRKKERKFEGWEVSENKWSVEETSPAKSEKPTQNDSSVPSKGPSNSLVIENKAAHASEL